MALAGVAAGCETVFDSGLLSGFPGLLVLGDAGLCFLNGFAFLSQELAHKLIGHLVEAVHHTGLDLLIAGDNAFLDLLVAGDDTVLDLFQTLGANA